MTLRSHSCVLKNGMIPALINCYDEWYQGMMTTEELLGYTFDAENKIQDGTMCDRCCHIIDLWCTTIKKATGKYVIGVAYERIKKNEADVEDMQNMYEVGILTDLKTTPQAPSVSPQGDQDTQVIE